MKDSRTSQPTPEQLLAILAAHRGECAPRRPRRDKNRVYYLTGAILLIVVVAGIALLVLGQMLGEMQGHGAFHASGSPEQL